MDIVYIFRFKIRNSVIIIQYIVFAQSSVMRYLLYLMALVIV